MGSMTFDREMKIEGSIFNHFSFDSSPKHSLCTALGKDPETFRLEQTSETDKYVRYDVYAANYSSGEGDNPSVRKLGTLVYEKQDARELRLASR